MRVPILTASLAVLSAATADVESAVSLGSEGRYRRDFVPGGNFTTISKTIRSSKLRLVFWVGLEGSGHHTMVQSFDRAFGTNQGRDPNGGNCFIGADRYYLTHAMAKSPTHYAAIIDRARDDMRALARSAKSVSSPGAVETLCGRWSYPSDAGRDKVFQYLDVALMAELAEAEGVDLRIIYLKRSAQDILISTTVHRHFDR